MILSDCNALIVGNESEKQEFIKALTHQIELVKDSHRISIPGGLIVVGFENE
jgi:hypothetical protein